MSPSCSCTTTLADHRLRPSWRRIVSWTRPMRPQRRSQLIAGAKIEAVSCLILSRTGMIRFPFGLIPTRAEAGTGSVPYRSGSTPVVLGLGFGVMLRLTPRPGLHGHPTSHPIPRARAAPSHLSRLSSSPRSRDLSTWAAILRLMSAPRNRAILSVPVPLADGRGSRHGRGNGHRRSSNRVFYDRPHSLDRVARRGPISALPGFSGIMPAGAAGRQPFPGLRAPRLERS